MRSLSFIIASLLLLALSAEAQKVAILAPEASSQTAKFASHLSDNLSDKLHLLDAEMSLAAFRSVKLDNTFNLDGETGKRDRRGRWVRLFFANQIGYPSPHIICKG